MMRAALKRCNNLSRFPLTRTYGQEFSRLQIHKIDHKERYSSVENLDPPIQTAADAINNSKYPKDSVETKRILSHLDWKIAEGASIATAAEILINQKVGALAVYNKIDDIVGVISQRDFINNLQSIEKAPKTTTVRDVCTHDVLSVDKTTPIQECARLLSYTPEFQGHHLVVRDKERGDKGIGLISIQDVLRSYMFQRDAHVSILLSQYIEDTVALS